MNIWRVLVVHAHYQQRGGEDAVFEGETALMEEAGWIVSRLEGHNRELEDIPAHRLATRLVWSSEWVRQVQSEIRAFKPDVVHFHNTFPLMSPAVIRAAKSEGVPVVQSLHNFRLGCLAATLFRDGEVCQDCLGRLPVHGVRHGCWRGRGASAAMATGYAVHRFMGTYDRCVDRYVVLAEALKPIYEKIGLPSKELMVKPNCLYPEPGLGEGGGGFGLFAGRLSPEKGLPILLEAWRGDRGLPLLKIAGSGPLQRDVEAAVAQVPNVEFIGSQPHADIQKLLQNANFLVVPSVWYEACPMIMVEALASGTPVVASDFPTMREHLGPGFQHLLFKPGDATDLARVIRNLAPSSGGLRGDARRRYIERFSGRATLARLNEIYSEARESANALSCGREE